MTLSSVYAILPPWTAYLWLVPLYLQAFLLHPRVGAHTSRPLRLLLTLPTAYFALRAPLDCFAPRDTARFLNAGFGFMALFGLWKSVEWGCTVDRTAYDFVGFGQAGFAKQVAYKEGARRGVQPKEDEVTEARKKDGWIKVFFSQLHLLMSYRHLGYRSYTGRPPPPTTTTAFIRGTAKRWIASHVLFTLCMAFVTMSVADKCLTLMAVCPWLKGNPHALETTRQTVASAAVAAMAWTGLALTHSIYSVGYFMAINAGRWLGLPLDPFEPREYVALFGRVYVPTSIKRFWGQDWHQLLRVAFQTGGGGAYAVARRLGCPKPIAQLAAALAVVAATSAIHEYALGSAIAGLDTLGPRTSSVEKHGGVFFFAIMVGLGLAEEGFRAATGRRVGGPVGFVWTSTAMGAAALYFLKKTWLPTYLLKGVPEPGEWSWVRWVVPLMSAMPAPLWTKA